MPAVALKFYTLNKTYKVEDTSTYQYNPWLLKHARVKFYWTMNMYTITNDNNDTGIAITSMLRLIRCKYYTNVWYVMAAAACLIWKYTFVWLFDYCSYGLVWSGRLSIPNYESVSTVSCHVRYRVALVSGWTIENSMAFNDRCGWNAKGVTLNVTVTLSGYCRLW